MADASRDQNYVPTLLGVSSSDGTTPVKVYADPTTHRLLTDTAAGSGTVTSVSVVTANGFSGTVATATTTPAITLSTTITGLLKGDGTAISAASAATDYAALAFKTISVSGQSDVVADSPVDTLTFVAGTNMTITTNAGTDTITFNASGSSGATTALDNLASVSINTSLLAQTGVDLGSTAKPFRDAYLWGNGTFGTTYLKLTGTPTSTRTLTIPDATDTFGLLAATQAFTNKTYNGNTWTAGTGVLTIAAGKTLTANSSLTLAGTDAKTLTVSNSGTLSGGDAFVLSIAAGKTLTVSNTLTLAGTDATTMTFPTTTATIARTDAGQTFTGVQNFTSPDTTTSITTSTTSFTAWAGATTLLTIGGTGASASMFAPSTLDATSSVTGAIRTSGGISAAKALNIGTTITGGGNLTIGTSNSATVGTIELGAATDTTLSRSGAGVLAVEGVVIPSISSTNTLTNKRITRRLTTVSGPGATPSTNTDNVDVANFTALATAITSMTTNLTGTPVDGDLVEFRFTDNGTARGITWGASFGSTTVSLPTTTVISTMLRVLVEWNGTIWQCIAVA